jgi:hypothetical protein
MSALEEQIGGNWYKTMAIQPIEFCHKNNLGYAESMAIKYLCRHGSKNGKQDLEKAIHCIKLLIEMEYPEVVEKEKETTFHPGGLTPWPNGKMFDTTRFASYKSGDTDFSGPCTI